MPAPVEEFFNRCSQNFSSAHLELINELYHAAGLHETFRGKTAEVSCEMIREMEAHLPFSLKTKSEQWEWKAEYLTKALAEPNKPCECCGVTPQGDIHE